MTITFQTELLLSFENFQISLYHLVPDPSLIHLDLVNLTVLITCPWQSFPYCRSPKDGRKATWVFSNLNFHSKALQWESIQYPWLWLFGIKCNDSGNVDMSQVWGCWVTKGGQACMNTLNSWLQTHSACYHLDEPWKY